jgi:hypothetical protein
MFADALNPPGWCFPVSRKVTWLLVKAELSEVSRKIKFWFTAAQNPSLEENYEQSTVGVIAAAAGVLRVLHRVRRQVVSHAFSFS